jgi:hypothetical protein
LLFDAAAPLSIYSDRIAQIAKQILFRLLVQDYGLEINPVHRIALEKLLETYALLVTGEQSGRVAIPMPPGSGKSQSVLALIAALHQLHNIPGSLPRNYSVLVAAERVESLCELLDDLFAMRHPIHKDQPLVPEDQVGLLHSLGGNVSRQSTDGNEERPFLFVTHARLRSMRRENYILTKYKGHRRDVLIWDESLLRTDSWAIPKTDLESDILWLGPHIAVTRDKDGLQQDRLDAHRFLTECLPLLHDDEDRVVQLPQRTQEELERYADALKNLRRSPSSEAIWDFFNVCWRELRVRRGSQHASDTGSYISYTLKVPDFLDRIVVLDASYPIRLLEKVDPTIQVHPHPSGHRHRQVDPRGREDPDRHVQGQA